MPTVTKKQLVDQIADDTNANRTVTRQVVQAFLDVVVVQLGQGHRIELRGFGVFEVRHRKARTAQNPMTLEQVKVPANRTVKFKPGRTMKESLARRKRSSAK